MLNARQSQLLARFRMWKRMDMYGKQRGDLRVLERAGLVRAVTRHVYEIV